MLEIILVLAVIAACTYWLLWQKRHYFKPTPPELIVETKLESKVEPKEVAVNEVIADKSDNCYYVYPPHYGSVKVPRDLRYKSSAPNGISSLKKHAYPSKTSTSHDRNEPSSDYSESVSDNFADVINNAAIYSGISSFYDPTPASSDSGSSYSNSSDCGSSSSYESSSSSSYDSGSNSDCGGY